MGLVPLKGDGGGVSFSHTEGPTHSERIIRDREGPLRGWWIRCKHGQNLPHPLMPQ